MLDFILLLTAKLVNSYLFIKLLTLLIASMVLIIVVISLYTILVYCVLIRFKFFRELLKEVGLPIPIEYKDTKS